MFPSRKHDGFTLIELLVVIAIIAILAAILFPVFARARENARKSNCISNLKQLSLGAYQYAQDYDETFPEAWATPAVYFWSYAIKPYVKNTDVFRCPSSSNHRYAETYSEDRCYMSIGYNAYFSQGRDRSLASMSYSADDVILGDTCNGPSASGYRGYEFYMSDSSRRCNQPETFATRHMDGAVLGFADGHAKWMPEGAINARKGIRLWSPW